MQFRRVDLVSFCLLSMIFTIILVRFHSLAGADDVAAWAPHLNLLLAQHLQTNLYQVMMVMMMMMVIMMLWPSLGVGDTWLIISRVKSGHSCVYQKFHIFIDFDLDHTGVG